MAELTRQLKSLSRWNVLFRELGYIQPWMKSSKFNPLAPACTVVNPLVPACMMYGSYRMGYYVRILGGYILESLD